MIDNLVSIHLLPAYKQNRAHSRHYRSEYVRGYLHRKRCVLPSWLLSIIPYGFIHLELSSNTC